MPKKPCTKAEYSTMKKGLHAAKLRLAYAQKAPANSIIRASIPSIQSHIRYIKQFLSTHDPYNK